MIQRIDYLLSGIGSIIGAAIAYCYGNLDTVLICLFGCITLDYISGVIVACYEKKLSSEIGFKGLLKKAWILLIVGLSGLLDKSLGFGSVARSMVCCFYICNETISIVENGSKLGIPFPKKLLDMVLSAKRKNDKGGNTDGGKNNLRNV
jgi:toxin secretion/phage lysis holin